MHVSFSFTLVLCLCLGLCRPVQQLIKGHLNIGPPGSRCSPDEAYSCRTDAHGAVLYTIFIISQSASHFLDRSIYWWAVCLWKGLVYSSTSPKQEDTETCKTRKLFERLRLAWQKSKCLPNQRLSFSSLVDWSYQHCSIEMADTPGPALCCCSGGGG